MAIDIRSRLGVSQEALEEFCRKHHIRRLSLFGSVVREDFAPQSDIDVLVEFEPGHTPGFKFFGMERELSDMFGRTVDLNTRGFLSDRIRDEVLAEAEVLFDATGRGGPTAAHAQSRERSGGDGSRQRASRSRR